jgi:hypothetical protein
MTLAVYLPTSLRRLIVLACVLAASLAVVSFARASFTSSAGAGPLTVTSGSLSPAGSPTAACSNGTATLGWTVTGTLWADGYDILRGTTTGGPYTHLAYVNSRTTLTYADATVTTGSYFYVIRAKKQNWRSASTTQVTVNSSNC